MLFNSFAFLLVFLPAALILHALVEHYRPDLRLPLLVVISVVFYAYWDWHFVPLLVASVGLNWLVAEYYVATRKQFVIPLAIAANLLVLGIFKYLNFFLELASATTKAPVPHLDIVLPLGISFFTFHHIMYLADLRAGRAPRFETSFVSCSSAARYASSWAGNRPSACHAAAHCWMERVSGSMYSKIAVIATGLEAGSSAGPSVSP